MDAVISLDRFNVTKSKNVRILTVGAWVIVVTICLFILWQGIKWQGKPSRLLRQWGSGGFGGYIGWFSGGGLGSHFEYVGKYQDAFYLKLCKGKPYMLSCDEVERVVEHIQSVISR